MKLSWLFIVASIEGRKISLENALDAFSQRYSELQLERYDDEKFLKKKIKRIAAKINRKKVCVLPII